MAHSADPHRRCDKQKPVGALALSRRKLPVPGAGPAAALAGLETLRHLAAAPVRLPGDAETAPAWSGSAPAGLPDVQFDLAKFVAPVVTAVTFQGADGVSVTTAEAGDYFDNGSMQHLSHVILDMPDGSRRPKLEFTAFVPSADFFTTMRKNQASAGLQEQFGAEEPDNGLERFITSTRRQNFLIPPRRHRAFPFAELCGRG
jgi:hypothetical protein